MISVEMQGYGVCGWWKPLEMNCKSTLSYAFDPWEGAPLEQWQIDYVGPFKRSKEALY